MSPYWGNVILKRYLVGTERNNALLWNDGSQTSTIPYRVARSLCGSRYQLESNAGT